MFSIFRGILVVVFMTTIFVGRNVFAKEHDFLTREMGIVGTAEKLISKNYGLRFDADYRSLNDNLYLRIYEASLVRYFKDDLKVRLTHRWYYNYDQTVSDWKLGNMSHIRVSKGFETRLVDYGFRVGHEYFFGNVQGHQHRSRIRVSLRPHKKFYSIKPFISNEVFYRHERTRASRNWLSTGIEYYHSKSTRYYIFHRYETSESADKRYWNNHHGIFSGVYCRF